jgi:GPI mannosyltransferase 1 subunit M
MKKAFFVLFNFLSRIFENFRYLVASSILLHVLLLIWGKLQDFYSPRVPYTDIDYLVFSDAATSVLDGRSPYERATFRYSPLMAWICIPNLLFFKSFAKILFCLANIGVGYELYSILRIRGEPKTRASVFAAIFLLSPISANVSSRGSSDSLICYLVLRVLHLLLEEKEVMAAILFGLSVHLRIFPIIYALPIVLSIRNKHNRSDNNNGKNALSPLKTSIFDNISLTAVSLFSWRRLQFGLLSGSVFLSLGAFFYGLYGFPFLSETYLYHVSRNDIRHNFSASFYGQYLSSIASSSSSSLFNHSQLSSILSLLPFLGTSVTLGILLYRDLPLCLFSQTLAFVALNKVVTAQYFNWWMCLFPLVVANSQLKLFWTSLILAAVWVGSELHWLFWAFQLEIQGRSAYFGVWIAGLLFLIANSVVLSALLLSQKKNKQEV